MSPQASDKQLVSESMPTNTLSSATDLAGRIRPYIKPFLVVLIIYLIAMSSILRLGASYIDDMGRAHTGLSWSHEFNRFSQSFLSYMLNTSFTLTDISPWTQIVAMVFLSISSVVVTYLLCNRKIRYIPLILSVFIGLSPFVIELWLYKFDSPGMAMSIMVSILPFLFWHYMSKDGKKPWVSFLSVSTICVLLMLTSYQAAGGIYPVMLMAMAMLDFLNKQDFSKILKTGLFFVAPYLLGILIFVFVLPNPTGYWYTDTWPISGMIFGVLRNTRQYFQFIRSLLNQQWSTLMLLTLICYLISLLLSSKRKKGWKLLDVIIGTAFVLIAFPLSHGFLLALVEAPINTRSSLGIGLIFAVISILTVRNISTLKKPEKTTEGKSKIGKFANTCRITACVMLLPAIALVYSFFVYPLALGNALADQHRWGTFRREMVVADLAREFPEADITVQVRGHVGLSIVAEHVAEQYPIARHHINPQQQGLGEMGFWALYRFQHYYNMDLWLSFYWRAGAWDYYDWEVVVDNFYHTIRHYGYGWVSVTLR